jgi:hypothetical protein
MQYCSVRPRRMIPDELMHARVKAVHSGPTKNGPNQKSGFENTPGRDFAASRYFSFLQCRYSTLVNRRYASSCIFAALYTRLRPKGRSGKAHPQTRIWLRRAHSPSRELVTMRGNTAICHRVTQNEHQLAFSGLSRARRTKLALAAKTTLYMADRWAGGFPVVGEMATALQGVVSSRKAK